MKTKLLCLALVAGMFANPVKSQESNPNVIKMNLLALGFSNFSFQYERAFHKNMSFGVGLSFIPSRSLPDQLTSSDANLKKATFGGWSITPEFRFYPGKKEEKQAPRGFYLAPYLKYVSYSLDMPYTFKDSATGFVHTFATQAKFNAFGVGLLIGYQWVINERVSIDWWILGVHGGSANPSLTMSSATFATLSAADRTKLETELKELNAPPYSVDAQVNNSGVTVSLNGPYLGLRTGLCIGIAF